MTLKAVDTRTRSLPLPVLTCDAEVGAEIKDNHARVSRSGCHPS